MTTNLQEMTARGSMGIVIGCILSVLTLAGCGYSFAGRSDSFPKDIRTVYIEPFIDQTREVGLGQEVTSALRSEFYRRGLLQVVDRADQADGIITGVVRSFESHVATVNRNDEVLQYETAMIADAALRRREPCNPLHRRNLVVRRGKLR